MQKLIVPYPKTDAGHRRVPLDNWVLAELSEHCGRNGIGPGGYLFLSRAGTPVRSGQLAHLMKRLAVECDLVRVDGSTPCVPRPPPHVRLDPDTGEPQPEIDPAVSRARLDHRDVRRVRASLSRRRRPRPRRPQLAAGVEARIAVSVTVIPAQGTMGQLSGYRPTRTNTPGVSNVYGTTDDW